MLVAISIVLLVNTKSNVIQGNVVKSITEQKAVPDEILIRFNHGVSETVKQDILKQHGAAVKEEIPQIEAKLLKVDAAARDNVIDALSHNPNVAYAEQNSIAQAEYIPNDPCYYPACFIYGQWDMDMIGAPQAWDVTKGNPSIIVAVLDSGISQTHPDLAGKVVLNVKFDTSSSTVNDVYTHGTHVAGTIAANTDNFIGVAGIGFNTRLYNVKVLGDDGWGTYSAITQGIIWAADNGAQVISMSLGGTAASSAMEDAVNYAWNKGAVIVAAAGNNGDTNPMYPAYYQNVIAVASIDTSKQLASYSTSGDWVDVAAPGTVILSTITSGANDTYGFKSGTSMAAPHVSGLAALVFTQVNDTNMNGRLNDEVRACIQSTATNIGITGIGSGLINASAAVRCKAPPSPSSDTIPPAVHITSPNITTVAARSTVTITATAIDNIAISKVEFYINSILTCTDTTYPYSCSWKVPNSKKAYNILAKAYDTAVNSANSQVVTVTSK